MKMQLRITLLTLILYTCFQGGLAQLHLDWAFTTGSPASDHTGSMKSDHDDNLYIMSEYKDTLDLDPGPGVDIAFPATSPVLTLSKFTADGEYQWSGLFWDEAEVFGSIFEIRNNRMRLVLSFTDSLIYQLHGQNLIQESRPGSHSCFLDLSLEGQVLNIHYFATPYDTYITELFTLANGNTIISGSYRDTFSFSDEADQIVSEGGYDAFVALLDQDLQPVWMQSFGSVMDDYMSGMFYHPSGHVYFTFINDAPVTMETLEGTQTFPGNANENNVYGYMNISGDVVKAFAFGGELGDEIYTITADDAGNIYICGYFEGTVNFAHASQAPVMYTANADSDGFVAKYDQNGLLIWERVYINGDYGGVYTVDLKRGTELYLTGGVTGRSDLDPGPDSLIVDADSRSDIFVSKLTLDGELNYSYHFRGNEVEGIRVLIASTGSSKVFLHGFYYDSLDCDFTAGDYWLAGPGGADVFVMGFSEDNVISSVSTTSGASLLVYPNPVSDELYIEASDPLRDILLLTIDGQIVYHSDDGELSRASLDLGSLVPGIYLLRTQTDTDQQITRIIRE